MEDYNLYYNIFSAILRVKHEAKLSNVLLDYLGNLPPGIAKRTLLSGNEPIEGLEFVSDSLCLISLDAVKWNKIVFRRKCLRKIGDIIEFPSVSLFSEPFPVDINGLTLYNNRTKEQEIIQIVDMRKWVFHFRITEQNIIRVSSFNLLDKDDVNIYVEGETNGNFPLRIIDNNLIFPGSITKSAK